MSQQLPQTSPKPSQHFWTISQHFKKDTLLLNFASWFLMNYLSIFDLKSKLYANNYLYRWSPNTWNRRSSPLRWNVNSRWLLWCFPLKSLAVRVPHNSSRRVGQVQTPNPLLGPLPEAFSLQFYDFECIFETCQQTATAKQRVWRYLRKTTHLFTVYCFT